MSATSLYAKHADLAPRMAARFPAVPGLDREDVIQEARVGLWIAATTYLKERGSFRSFAADVIWKRLADLLKAATRGKRTGIVVHDGFVELVGGPEPERVVVARETLDCLIAAVGSLSPFERQALVDSVNGENVGKPAHNAAYRARQKLKEAA